MSDSSTWPRLKNTRDACLAWCKWCDSEPDTIEKWRHIFAEKARDRREFFALLDRKAEERRMPICEVPTQDVASEGLTGEGR